MKNNDVVTTFEEIKITISGAGGEWTPPVSSVVIRLKAGGLPIILATVDGVHQTEKGQENGVDAELVTFSNVKSWHDRAQTYVSDPATRCAVHIELLVNGEKQVVDVTGWLLLAAGFGAVSTSGGCPLELMMQHPAGQLDRCGGILGNKSGEKSIINWNSAAFTNPVSGFANATVAATDMHNIVSSAWGDTGALISAAYSKTEEEIINKAKLALTLLNWNPKWPNNDFGYSDLPLSNSFLQNHVPAVQSTFLNYVEGLPGTSLWSTFIDSVCTDFDITVIPTYWSESLQVVPYTPYGNPVITIYDDMISRVEFPAIDPAPVGGARIVISGNGRDDSNVTYGMIGGSGSPMKTTDVIYLNKSGQMLGKVVALSAPSWLTGAKSYDGGQEKGVVQQNKDGDMTTDDDSVPVGYGVGPGAASGFVGAKVPEGSADYVNACYAYAKAEFLSRYGETSEISLSTALLIRSDDGLFHDRLTAPGCVFRIAAKNISNPDAKAVPFIDMYVTELVHVIDAKNADAHTEISGAYCRPVDGGRIKSGTPNPLYYAQPVT